MVWEPDIGLILVPRKASVTCAAGQLLSDLLGNLVKSRVMWLEWIARQTAEAHYPNFRRASEEALLEEGVPWDRIALGCIADPR